MAVWRCLVKLRIGKNAGWRERAKLLGERLGFPFPSNATAEDIQDWFVQMFFVLAELYTPEFRLQRLGRPRGSKTREERLNSKPDDGAEKQRRKRQRQAEMRRLRAEEDVRRWMQGDKTVPLPPGWGWLNDQPFPFPEDEEFIASLEAFQIQGDKN
jgi:hypothetical protein